MMVPDGSVASRLSYYDHRKKLAMDRVLTIVSRPLRSYKRA
jgi:hypothetical protein